MNTCKKWTDEENEMLLKEFNNLSESELKNLFGRSFKAVQMHALRLGIKRNREQSYVIRVFNFLDTLLYEKSTTLNDNAKANKVMILKKVNRKYRKQLISGGCYISITHNLECFQNDIS
jgi:hypothetical protein